MVIGEQTVRLRWRHAKQNTRQKTRKKRIVAGGDNANWTIKHRQCAEGRKEYVFSTEKNIIITNSDGADDKRCIMYATHVYVSVETQINSYLLKDEIYRAAACRWNTGTRTILYYVITKRRTTERKIQTYLHNDKK